MVLKDFIWLEVQREFDHMKSSRSKNIRIIMLMLIFCFQNSISAQETICNDLIDNDGDGLIDCADSDCITTNLCATVVTDCTFESSTFSFVISGNAVADYVDEFTLTDLSGVIVDISTISSFSNIASGDYFLFHLNYHNSTTISGNIIGMPIGNVTGDCFEVSGGFKIKVCPSSSVACNLDLSVWLEGPYELSENEMKTVLNDFQLLPGQDPLLFVSQQTPAGQPYNTSIWNYNGEEGDNFDYNIVGDGRAGYPSDVVDWVLVSLRNDITENSTFCKQAAWVTKSGAIVFPISCDCTLTLNEEIYIVIEHRNHLPIMTPNPITVTNAGANFDFRNQQSYKTFTGDGQKNIGSGIFAMYAANADQDILDASRMDINATDESIWTITNSIGDIYIIGDFDLNGDINGNDESFWLKNTGKSSDVPFLN